MLLIEDFSNKLNMKEKRTYRFLTTNNFDSKDIKVIKTKNGIFLGIDVGWKNPHEDFSRLETLKIHVDRNDTAYVLIPVRKPAYDFQDDGVIKIEMRKSRISSGQKINIVAGFPVCSFDEKTNEFCPDASIFKFLNPDSSSLYSSFSNNQVVLNRKGLAVLAKYVENHQDDINKQINYLELLKQEKSKPNFDVMKEVFGDEFSNIFNIRINGPIEIDIEEEARKQNFAYARYFGEE